MVESVLFFLTLAFFPRVGQQNAWQVPPKSQPTISQPSTQPGMSFLAIQQLQQEQAAPAPKEKHSLLEIKTEERDWQGEEDFLKWWTAEEDRLKLTADPFDTTGESERRGKSNRGKGKGRPKSEAAASKASEAEACAQPF
jgi:inhibitor of Bruton tyrosine kinase